MNPLDIRDISIIDALPVYNCEKIILNVGCGKGRIDYHLSRMGYRIYATDIEADESWEGTSHLTFYVANIFDPRSFPIPCAPIVICSQVLEHLKDYRNALKNLIALTEIRLILTIPHKKSFHSPEHLHFWDDRNVVEFINLCRPYSVSISKILTKPEDVKRKQCAYLIIIDKRQEFASK